MSTTSLFDHVAALVEEIGAEKQAAARKHAEDGISDPGGAEGPTSHPSKKTDDDLQPSTEGEQSADNERRIKESIPDAVDKKPDETPGGAPKATEVQQGQGVDIAKPTGEDPGNEQDYKGKPEGDKREGDQGGTSHPAKGDYGEKYSADKIAELDNTALLKTSADLGNDLTSDVANGFFSPAPVDPPKPKSTTKQAADTGKQTAEAAGDVGEQLEKIASGVVQEVVKAAYHQADLVTEHLARELATLQKQAEGEEDDPTSGAGEGEDHGSEGEGGGEAMPAEAGGEAAPEGAEELLAAMAGGGEPGGGELGGAPPEGLGGGGGLEGLGGGPEGGLGGGLGEPPAELGGMDDQAALQQLAMALIEAGIDPAQLAALGSPEGAKIASAVQTHKRSGRFAFEEAKQGSAKRKVRDYMKGFVLELYNRSRK